MSNIFVFFFRMSQWLDDWWKIKNKDKDTGGNIKKAEHLGQDEVCKGQM